MKYVLKEAMGVQSQFQIIRNTRLWYLHKHASNEINQFVRLFLSNNIQTGWTVS